MTFWKSDFFVQFRVFYNKEFTRQKKVTNKLFISVRCVVIAKRGESVRSARWNSVGCVSMWWFMYIEGYIFVFWYTEEMGVIYVPFCLLLPFGGITFPAFFTFSPIYDFSYEKFLFFFFLFCFLIKNDFLIRNKIKKHIS